MAAVKKFQWRPLWRNAQEQSVGTGVLNMDMSMRVLKDPDAIPGRAWRWELHHNGMVRKGNVDDRVEAMRKAQDAYIDYLR